MKTAQYIEVIEWECPYKSCREWNTGELYMSFPRITNCFKCKRDVKVVDD